jgi:hypothetical protein
LRAHCLRSRHHRVWARLERVSTCVGDVLNYQGELICLRKRNLPRGDWRDTCINPHLSAPGMFAAVCKSGRRGWTASVIPLAKCGTGITNVRGHLGCRKPKIVEAPSPGAPRSTLPPPAEVADDDAADEPAAPPVAPPAGPYQSKCRDIAFDGHYLSGQCSDDRGRWQDTSLDTKSCARDQVIGNDDGELVCTHRPGQTPPTGAYQATCRDVTFDGRFVRADCKDATGTWMRAVLDTRPCEDGDEIVNEDAELICRAPAPPAPPASAQRSGTAMPQTAAPGPSSDTGPPPPRTAPAQSLTLYDGAGFEGASKTVSGDIPDLSPIGWRNLASSLQVKGGAWEVCDQANYQGHCERVVEDAPDLADIGLSNRINSVRQLHEPSPPAEP